MLFVALIVTLFTVANGLRMAMDRQSVLKPFVEGKALKVISGLLNFDTENVKSVAFAACTGGASHVDIACDADLVKAVKSVCSLPVCVSSVKPKDFLKAVEAGADMVEIGNFDGFYDCGMTFSADDILEMTKETRALLPFVPLSVTVPHTLSLAEQVQLAQNLEKCGVDIIQTEGKMGVEPRNQGVKELIEKATPALSSAYSLSRAVSIPVLCSSGLTDITAPMALAAGAKGVGIGSMVNKQKDMEQMYLAVRSIAKAMGRQVPHNSVHQESYQLPSESVQDVARKSMNA